MTAAAIPASDEPAHVERVAQATYADVLSALLDTLAASQPPRGGRGGRPVTAAANLLTATAGELYPDQGRTYRRNKLEMWLARGTVPLEDSRVLYTAAVAHGVPWPAHLEVLTPTGAAL